MAALRSTPACCLARAHPFLLPFACISVLVWLPQKKGRLSKRRWEWAAARAATLLPLCFSSLSLFRSTAVSLPPCLSLNSKSNVYTPSSSDQAGCTGHRWLDSPWMTILLLDQDGPQSGYSFKRRPWSRAGKVNYT